jgi:phospholipid/cholesterol/gamma-HCH transport system substrate-binding protein
MATQKTKLTVGIFVAGGLTLAIIAIIALGMFSFFRKGQYYATYFDESVQGLDVDSLVKYRGVSIGRVDSIDVAPDSKLIQVVLKIETGQPLGNDLVAQLKIVGITGSVFVELDRKKLGEPNLSPRLTFPSEYPIVASKPSDISQILHGIDDVLKQVKNLDTGGISDKIKFTLDNINDAIDEAHSAMATGGRTLARVEGIIIDEEQNIKTAVEDMGLAIKEARVTFEKGSSMVSSTDDSIGRILTRLLVVSQNLEKGTEDLNRLIELLTDQPSRLIFDQPPTPKKVEE